MPATPVLMQFNVTQTNKNCHAKFEYILMTRTLATQDSALALARASSRSRMHARERNFVHQDSPLRDAPAPAYGPEAHLMSHVTSERDFERGPRLRKDRHV